MRRLPLPPLSPVNRRIARWVPSNWSRVHVHNQVQLGVLGIAKPFVITTDDLSAQDYGRYKVFDHVSDNLCCSCSLLWPFESGPVLPRLPPCSPNSSRCTAVRDDSTDVGIGLVRVMRMTTLQSPAAFKPSVAGDTAVGLPSGVLTNCQRLTLTLMPRCLQPSANRMYWRAHTSASN